MASSAYLTPGCICKSVMNDRRVAGCFSGFLLLARPRFSSHEIPYTYCFHFIAVHRSRFVNKCRYTGSIQAPIKLPGSPFRIRISGLIQPAAENLLNK